MGIPKKKEFIFSKSESNSSWKIELENFYDSIIKSKKCSPDLQDVYSNLKIINQIYK